MTACPATKLQADLEKLTQRAWLANFGMSDVLLRLYEA